MNSILDENQISKTLGDIDRLVQNWQADDASTSAKFEKRFAWKVHKDQGSSKFELVHRTCSHWKSSENFFIANLVLQGGGTLGLAHVGLIAGLERAGIRFAGLAGASAGSIVASGIFAIRGPDITKASAAELAKLVGSAPFDNFIDGPRSVRMIIKRLLNQKSVARLDLLRGFFQARRQILSKRGLNPGRQFEAWMQSVFDEFEIRSIEDMLGTVGDVLSSLQSLALEGVMPFRKMEKRHVLGMNTSCLPTGHKIDFPDKIELFHPSYLSRSPAILARASMSVPLFFEPLAMRTDTKRWSDFIEKDRNNLAPPEALKKSGERKEVTFLDGGLFSNLPADRFFDDMPDIPTIAVPLISAKPPAKYRRKSRLPELVDELAYTANVTRLVRDRDAISKIREQEIQWRNKVKNWNEKAHASTPETSTNKRQIELEAPTPELPLVLLAIDTGEHNFLNFNLSYEDQKELVLSGVDRAKKFLEEGM